MNFKELLKRKDLLITALVSYLIGCLLGTAGLIIFAIGIIVYFILRWKGYFNGKEKNQL